MINYNDKELEILVKELESDLVERKRTAGDRSAIRRTICAFANDLPGHGRPGVIFIGIENDGQCAKLNVTDDLLNTLAQMRQDGNLMPFPSMIVEKRTIGDCSLVVVIVAPSTNPPVRYQGRVYVKVGPTVQQASPEEEHRLAERRRAADLSFDLRPSVSSTIQDLDIDYFQSQYLPRAVAPDVLDQNRRTVLQQLEALHLTFNGIPTHGALIAIGRDPQRWIPGAWVQFLRIDGLEPVDPIRDQKTLTGRIGDILKRLDDVLKTNISIRTDITTSSRELNYPDYPVSALQQFVRNAIMHRSYEGTHSPVRIYWYNDRVEISSPGGLYGRVTPTNFGKGATDYRNPLIAEIMHHLGYAQRFGVGIPIALQELDKNGNKQPEFDFQPLFLGITVRKVT